MMRVRLLLAGCVMAAMLAGGCVDDDPYKLKDLPKPPVEPSSQATATTGPVPVGQSTNVGPWFIVVKKVEKIGSEADSRNEGRMLVILTTSLANGGTVDAETHPDYFVLVGPDGKEYSPQKATDPGFIHETADRALVAGENREISMVFEVDATDEPLTLRFLPQSEKGTSEPALVEIR